MTRPRIEAKPDAPMRHAAAALSLAALCLPLTARADGEAWAQFEYRLPVVQGPAPRWPRVDVRIYSEARFAGRADGINETFLRVGPLVYLTPWLFVATHATASTLRASSGQHVFELRAELEPNLFGRLGPFTFNDRNRVEMRWREAGVRWRYRNQLRVAYQPPGARVFPFVWDELLFDLSPLPQGPSVTGLQQNRASAGLSVQLHPNVRFDVAYLLRSRREAASATEPERWEHDHGAVVALFVDVPR